MTELNLKKELETYFYNKGFGSESAQEASDMTAFLKTLFNQELKYLACAAKCITNDISTLRTNLFRE